MSKITEELHEEKHSTQKLRSDLEEENKKCKELQLKYDELRHNMLEANKVSKLTLVS